MPDMIRNGGMIYMPPTFDPHHPGKPLGKKMCRMIEKMPHGEAVKFLEKFSGDVRHAQAIVGFVDLMKRHLG